jgi:branched-chain amino acid transport system substrate-binding protein
MKDGIWGDDIGGLGTEDTLLMRIASLLVLLFAVLLARASADGPPLKIGMTSVYSGTQTQVGQGADAAVAAYLALHGDTVAGRKVVVVRRDEQGPTPEISKRIAQELVLQEHVDFLIGGLYSPNALAIGDISTQAKVPFFITAATAPGITVKMPYAARLGFTGPQQAVPMAKWALQNKIATAYVIAVDNTGGIETAEAFEHAFTGGRGKVLGEVRIPSSTTDFSAYVQRIKDAAPQAVYAALINGTGKGGSFLRAFRAAGLDAAGIKILATMDMVTEGNLPGCGDFAVGVLSSGNYSAEHKGRVNARFLTAFHATKGVPDPDMLAVSAYDAMDAIYKLTEAQHGNLDPEKSAQLLKTLRLNSPRGDVAFDPETRDIVQTMYIRRTEKRGNKTANIELASYPNIDASHVDDSGR